MIQNKDYIFTDSLYLQTTGEIPIELPGDSFVSIKRSPPPQIYSVGFQPAKSIPEIPRWFLHKYASPKYTILDPFAGSGTTITETILFGAKAYWTDYHPLSQLICRIKTSKFDIATLESAYKELVQNINSKSKKTINIDFANRNFWFQSEVSEVLELIREEINSYNSSERDFLSIVLASTVRKMSNMNDGMILAARRQHIEAIPIRTRNDVIQCFNKYASQYVEAIYEWQYLAKGEQSKAIKISSNDARQLNNNIKFDAIITSPPYINAIDYVWASKFELHWLKLVNSDSERLDLYSQEIGTERIATKERNILGRTGHKMLDDLIEDIYTGKIYDASKGQNHLRSRVVWKYFMDMKNHLKEAYDVLKPSGFYCLSIGDSCRICGVKIPVATLLTDFAEQLGFIKIFRFQLLLKNRRLNIPRNVKWADTIKHDSVIVLQKKLI
jgi:DNA modification methylase